MQKQKRTKEQDRTLKKQYNNNRLSKIDREFIYNHLPDNFLTLNGITAYYVYKKFNSTRNCCSYTEVAKYQKVNEKTGLITSGNETVETNYCNNPLICSVCARRMQNERIAKYYQKLETMSKACQYVYLITKTIKDSVSFEEDYHKLNDANRRFYKKGENGYNGEYSKVKAAISKIEVKIGANSGLWHLHMHEIYFCDTPIDYKIYNQKIKSKICNDIQKRYNRKPTKKELLPAALNIETVNVAGGKTKKIAFSKLSKEWFRSVNDMQSLNIDVRRISDKEDILPECLEVLKYQSKTADMKKSHLVDMVAYSPGKRFFRTYGALRGIRCDDNSPKFSISDLVDVEGRYWNDKKKEYVNSDYAKNDELIKAKIVLSEERKEAMAETCYVLANLKKTISDTKTDIRIAIKFKKKTGKIDLIKDLISKINNTRDAHGKKIRDIIKEKYKDPVIKEHNRSDLRRYGKKHNLSFHNLYELKYLGVQEKIFS